MSVCPFLGSLANGDFSPPPSARQVSLSMCILTRIYYFHPFIMRKNVGKKVGLSRGRPYYILSETHSSYEAISN